MATVSSAEFFGKTKGTLVAPASENVGVPSSEIKKSGFLTDVVDSAKKRIGKIGDAFNRSGAATESSSITGQNPFETAVQTVGNVIGFGGDVIGAGLSAATPEVVKQKGLDLLKTETGQQAISALQSGAEVYKAWATKNPRAAADIEGVLNIASIIPAKKVADVGVDAATSIARGASSTLDDATKSVVQKLPKYADKAAEILASDPSKQVATILKETPKSKFDQFVGIAEKSAQDLRNPSTFEHVGQKMEEATKQLKKQAASIGEQKSNIINKANIGLTEFKEAPRRAILAVNAMDDNPLKKSVISLLKGIKTKADADKVIDKVQSMIYDSVGTKVIAGGSSTEKQFRRIIGTMNEELKQSLPDSYRVLNTKYANRVKVLETLNNALGEVVEGVPSRGASLIKQFFSPSGSKTKELFAFIKKNTGIDLAQDATLAKFTGELFNDPRVRSLLQGVPTSRSGVINSAIDFAVEKTGVGERLQNTARKATIKRARKITL